MLDTPGKDSTRQLAAGASFSVVCTDEKWAMHQHGPLDEMALRSHAQTDVLLLEGFKKSNHPKVICVHPEKEVPDELGWNNPSPHRAPIWAYLTPDQSQATEINQNLRQPLAFQRDNVESISDHLLTQMKQYYQQLFPLNGAVMIGGKSTRMGEDKAWLDYGKGPHAVHLFDLLTQTTTIEKVFYSGTPLSAPPQSIASETILRDRFLDFGPLGGILTLFEIDPNTAWLVIACDLVDLQNETIAYLIQNRNPLKVGTVFFNKKKRFEPLMAIYEPHMGLQLKRSLLDGKYSFQQIFQQLSIHQLRIPANLEAHLHNVNSMAERQSTLRLLNAGKKDHSGVNQNV